MPRKSFIASALQARRFDLRLRGTMYEVVAILDEGRSAESHGVFDTLEGAKGAVEFDGLVWWEIWYDNSLVAESGKPETDDRDLVIEFPMIGTTYSREEYGVYEYGEYPDHSVLAGQTRRSCLGAFPSLRAAQIAYPTAKWSGEGSNFVEASLIHLPGDDDTDPKGEDRDVYTEAQAEGRAND